MSLFKYYRIAFVVSFIILIIGSVVKVTHIELGFFKRKQFNYHWLNLIGYLYCPCVLYDF